MTKYHKELNELAERINEYDCLVYKIVINRRNGYYHVDNYKVDESFYGAMFIGEYEETKAFLKGLQYGYFFCKPF